MFFVSVASKQLSCSISPLDATLVECFVSVDSTGLAAHRIAQDPLGLEKWISSDDARGRDAKKKSGRQGRI
jgi:hypothetical protein